MKKFILLFILLTFWASCQKYKEPDKVKLLISQKKFDEALKEAQKETNEVKKLNYLGIIYSSKKDFKKAEEYYKEALKKSPKNFKALYNSAILKIKTKNFKEALTLFKTLEEEFPQNIDVKIKKAWTYYYLLSNSNAVSTLKELVNSQRKNLSMNNWKEISDLYFKLKRYNAAAEAYDYYVSMAKKQNIKIDFKKAEKRINFLRNFRNQEL